MGRALLGGDESGAQLRPGVADPQDLRIASPELIFNVSDILLDRRDLLAEYARATSAASPLPPRAPWRTSRCPCCAGTVCRR